MLNLGVLANENNRKIINMLLKKEMTPTEMLISLGIQGPGLSARLKELELFGLVSKKRVKNHIHYSIRQKGINELKKQFADMIGNSFKNARMYKI